MKSVLALCLLGTSLSVHAATLSVTYQATAPNGTAATSLTLPTGPGTDWGYYDRQSDEGSPLMSPSNSAATSNSNFVISTVNGGQIRGPGNLAAASSLPQSFFDFGNNPADGNEGRGGDDGEYPFTGTDVRPSGVFNSQLGTTGVNAGGGTASATGGAGVRMTLTGLTGQSQIQIWTFGFQATGLFEVFVNGATSAAYSQSVVMGSSGLGKPTQLFTLNFTPDSTASTIDVVYRMRAATDTNNAHVGIQAFAISPIPEPAAVSLLGIAGVLGLIRRRR